MLSELIPDKVDCIRTETEKNFDKLILFSGT